MKHRKRGKVKLSTVCANVKVYTSSRSISLEVIPGLVQEISGFLLESFHVNYNLRVRVIYLS